MRLMVVALIACICVTWFCSATLLTASHTQAPGNLGGQNPSAPGKTDGRNPSAPGKYLSHKPLRPLPTPSQRPRATGAGHFVDPVNGNDADPGTEAAPWKSLAHAIPQMQSGDTLYLRGGTYYEQVYCALAGTQDNPLTIRSYPGELAILDGSLREFTEQPATAWEPAPDAPGEFQSTRKYPNLRDVYGWFGDSFIGLNTYHNAEDMRAENELIDWIDWDNTAKSDLKPLYCGPGLWYDKLTGSIRVRLSHTHLDGGLNYSGETDPRKLSLIIAPMRSVTLHLDGTRHLRLQDLVIRGGGYETVALDQTDHITFENVTIYAGSYGLKTIGSRHLKIDHCRFYGSCPPWIFRADSSLRSYPGRPHRDITRFNTHALLVGEAGREFSVFALPVNDEWEIAHSEFTDAHDGVYLGGVSVRFHHNLLDGFQDDGIYLSPMSPRYASEPAQIQVYQNLFQGCLTALAFGGPEPKTTDQISIYRNVFDLRQPLYASRPRIKNTKVVPTFGKLMGDHGSPPWPAMNIYHNTVVQISAARSADLEMLGATSPERPRRVFNNLLVHLTRLPAARALPAENGAVDGMLYWFPGIEAATARTFFDKFRNSPAFEASKAVYSDGFLSHAQVLAPGFLKLETSHDQENDYRLMPDSPAVDSGIAIPAEWPDPLRDSDAGRPDIGAFPLKAQPLAAGPR